MKKKTVTSETEEITIDNKKKKERRKESLPGRIRWDRLVTRHIFFL